MGFLPSTRFFYQPSTRFLHDFDSLSHRSMGHWNRNGTRNRKHFRCYTSFRISQIRFQHHVGSFINIMFFSLILRPNQREQPILGEQQLRWWSQRIRCHGFAVRAQWLQRCGCGRRYKKNNDSGEVIYGCQNKWMKSLLWCLWQISCLGFPF